MKVGDLVIWQPLNLLGTVVATDHYTHFITVCFVDGRMFSINKNVLEVVSHANG